MRISKLIIAAALTMVAMSASAEPKCSHRKSTSLFANTNPVATNAVKSLNSSSQTGGQ